MPPLLTVLLGHGKAGKRVAAKVVNWIIEREAQKGALGTHQMSSLRSLAFILCSAIRRARALSCAALHSFPDIIKGRKTATNNAKKMATNMAASMCSLIPTVYTSQGDHDSGRKGHFLRPKTKGGPSLERAEQPKRQRAIPIIRKKQMGDEKRGMPNLTSQLLVPIALIAVVGIAQIMFAVRVLTEGGDGSWFQRLFLWVCCGTWVSSPTRLSVDCGTGSSHRNISVSQCRVAMVR
jgi:hypothetical protein